jgi:hypothetical protein
MSAGASTPSVLDCAELCLFTYDLPGKTALEIGAPFRTANSTSVALTPKADLVKSGRAAWSDSVIAPAGFPESPTGWSLTESSEIGGFFGAAFRRQDGCVVVVFNGTDDLGDLVDDASIFMRHSPPQLSYAVNFYQRVTSSNGGSAYVAGHSLGGALAIGVSLWFGTACVAFNSPGMATEYSDIVPDPRIPFSRGYEAQIRSGRIFIYRPEYDPVSSVSFTGPHIGQVRTLKTNSPIRARHKMQTCLDAVRADPQLHVPLSL